jgi:glycosyltransferase involved in cell wall biosynthesis
MDKQVTPQHILFVGDRHLVPPTDGTATVYCAVLEALASRYLVSAVMFIPPDTDSTAMDAYLSGFCEAHLVIQEKERSWFAKLARVIGRSFTAGLFAPPFIEQLGRRSVHRQFTTFIRELKIDIIMVSKMTTIFRIGKFALPATGPLKLIDLHDDYITREANECWALRRMQDQHSTSRILRLWFNRTVTCNIPFSIERARRQEKTLLRTFNRILVSSADELTNYRRISSDAERFVHLPWPLAVGRTPLVQADQFDAGFIGSASPMNAEAIIYFLNKVMPSIRQYLPQFRLLVVGSITPVASLLIEASKDIVIMQASHELERFYGSIKVAIVPLLSGSGLSVKTVEALSFGCPTVTTPIGARGLAVKHNKHLVIAETPMDFAENVVGLVQNPDLRSHMGQEGRKHVNAQYSKDRYLDTLDSVIKRALEERASPER